jgi:type I restriction enzyme M protein
VQRIRKQGALPREILQVKTADGKRIWPEEHDFKLGKRRFKSDLVPSRLLVARYFVAERDNIKSIETELAAIEQQLDEQREEQSGEDGLLAEVIEGEGDKQKISAKAVKNRLKEIGKTEHFADERKALEDYAVLLDKHLDAKERLKQAQEELEEKIAAKYGKLTDDDIKRLVVEDKWLASIEAFVQVELSQVSQTLTSRVLELAERYATPLPMLTAELSMLTARVDEHLKRMGATWD